MLTKKEAAERVVTLIDLFKPLVSKPVVMSFSKHSFTIVIESITQLTSEQVPKNIEKRPTGNGKNATPQVVGINADVGRINIALDDAIFVAIFNGVRVTVGETVIEFRSTT